MIQVEAMELRIRNLPVAVHKALKFEALETDSSLNAVVLRVLTAHATARSNPPRSTPRTRR